MICYTNHALDQFLEGVLEFEDNIVRIGSRSKSDALKEKNIRKVMYELGRTGKQHHRTRQDIMVQQDQLEGMILTSINTLNNRELSLVQLNTVARAQQIKHLIEGRKKYAPDQEGDVIKVWLNPPVKSKPATKKNGKPKATHPDRAAKPKKQTRQELQEEEEEDEYDEEIITRMQLDRMVGDDEFQDYSKGVAQIKDSTIFTKSFEISQDILNCDEVWRLSVPDRHLLYKYWYFNALIHNIDVL